MPQLDVSTYSSQVFWLLVSFLILFVVVRSLAAPRLMGMAKRRADQSGGDLAAAEAARKAEADAEAARASDLARAHEQARTTLATVNDAAKAKSAAALAELNIRLDADAERAAASLGAARANAEAELDRVARDVAGDLVQRLTGRTPEPARLDAALGAR